MHDSQSPPEAARDDGAPVEPLEPVGSGPAPSPFGRPDPGQAASAQELAPPLDGSLTQKVGRGVAWLMIQAIGTKAANTLSTLVLAWLLDKRDFALIAMTNSVVAFAGVFQQTGQREILIKRHAHFERWANPAFWMGLSAGLASMVLTMLAAPFVPLAFHHETRLIPLILIAALCDPIDALAVVPAARLQAQLRFGVIGTVGVCTAVLSLLLQTLLASPLVGAGAFAFVVPRPLVSAIIAVAYWCAAPVRIRRNPQFRRWKYMLRDSGAIFGLAVTGAVTMFGDNLTVGFVCSEAALGIYYFSYNSAFQALQMVIGSLQSALFPALAKIASDPVRQVNAYLRAARVSGLLGCFACLLQAILAAPLIHLVFAAKWYPAIPVFEVLSLAMAANALCGPVIGLFQAQGRFGVLLRYQTAVSLFFLLCVGAGAVWAQALGVAVGLLVLNVVITPITVALAVRPGGVRFGQVMAFLLIPLGLAMLAVLPAAAVAVLLPMAGIHSNLVVAVAGIATSVPVCGILLALWQPWAWHELRGRLRRLRVRRA